jgi:hypothetical protein
MNSSQSKWLMIAVASLAVLLIPLTLSMFAGQHTFHEVNDVKAGCSKCHEDIWQDLDGSPTIEAHKRAAGNTNYTTYMYVGGISYDQAAYESLDSSLDYYPVIHTIDFEDDTISTNSTYDNGDIAYFWNTSSWEKATWNASGSTFDSTSDSILISIDIDASGDISTDEVCNICHNITLFGLSSTHSKMTVRVCDDDRCHGNWNHSYNDPDIFTSSTAVRVTNVGLNLSSSIHSSFYQNASNDSSPYVAGSPFGHTAGNEYDSYISKGYWTCEGCHSGAQTDITFVEAEPYDHSDFSAERQRYR